MKKNVHAPDFFIILGGKKKNVQGWKWIISFYGKVVTIIMHVIVTTYRNKLVMYVVSALDITVTICVEFALGLLR